MPIPGWHKNLGDTAVVIGLRTGHTEMGLDKNIEVDVANKCKMSGDERTPFARNEGDGYRRKSLRMTERRQRDHSEALILKRSSADKGMDGDEMVTR